MLFFLNIRIQSLSIFLKILPGKLISLVSFGLRCFEYKFEKELVGCKNKIIIFSWQKAAQ
jgi:hypothetical protein